MIDESELPILKVHYPMNGTPAQFVAVWDEYCRVARANDRVVYLLDMRYASPMSAPAKVRRLAADLYQKYRHVLAPSAVCEARIVSNELIRGAITAFDWIKGDHLWPCRTFTDEAQARAWVEAQLRAEK
ncbi:MAG: hypothetical protein KC619_29275 [Myxococcales bacterium]|nr:hypothetical protein [Myxococcales bacterium]